MSLDRAASSPAQPSICERCRRLVESHEPCCHEPLLRSLLQRGEVEQLRQAVWIRSARWVAREHRPGWWFMVAAVSLAGALVALQTGSLGLGLIACALTLGPLFIVVFVAGGWGAPRTTLKKRVELELVAAEATEPAIPQQLHLGSVRQAHRSGATLVAPRSARQCIAYRLELFDPGGRGGVRTLLIMRSAGFVVELDAGGFVEVPAGAVELAAAGSELIHGPEEGVEQLLAELLPARGRTRDPIPYAGSRELRLELGDRVALAGPLRIYETEALGSAYRSPATPSLRPAEGTLVVWQSRPQRG